MCPVLGATLATTALGGGAAAGAGTLGALGTFAGIGGSIFSAISGKQNADAQADALAIQAADLERESRERIEQGKEDSDRARRRGAIQEGEQRAAFAANGIDVSSVSALDLLDDTQELIADDAFSIRENSRRSAQVTAAQAGNVRTQRKNVKRNARNRLIGTALGGASKVGAKFAGFSNSSLAADNPFGGTGRLF